MVNRFIIGLLVIVNPIFSKSDSYTQKSDKNLLYGNWQIVRHEKVKTIYQEIFIDRDYIYYWDENVGYLPKSKYFLEKRMLFHSHLGSDFEKLGKIKFVNQDLILIKKGKHKILYSRINSGKILQELINKSISERQFLESFYRRMETFKKRKSNEN